MEIFDIYSTEGILNALLLKEKLKNIQFNELFVFLISKSV